MNESKPENVIGGGSAWDNVRIYPDGRMDAKSAAVYLGVSMGALALWRCEGRGPRFVKAGRIWYFKNDLDEWLSGRVYRSTAQARLAMQSSSADGGC